LNPGDDYPDFVIPLAQAVVTEQSSAVWQFGGSGVRGIGVR